jgi:hypothetical protein
VQTAGKRRSSARRQQKRERLGDVAILPEAMTSPLLPMAMKRRHTRFHAALYTIIAPLEPDISAVLKGQRENVRDRVRS